MLVNTKSRNLSEGIKMTQDEIIRMVREVWPGKVIETEQLMQELERFAALVAANEREACAKLVETTHAKGLQSIREACAAAIRARGDK